MGEKVSKLISLVICKILVGGSCSCAKIGLSKSAVKANKNVIEKKCVENIKTNGSLHQLHTPIGRSPSEMIIVSSKFPLIRRSPGLHVAIFNDLPRRQRAVPTRICRGRFR